MAFLSGLGAALGSAGIDMARAPAKQMPRRGGGFLRGLRRALSPDNLAAAAAFAQEDPGLAFQINAAMREREAAEMEARQAQEREARRAEMLSQLGFSKPEIGVMTPADASGAVRAARAPNPNDTERDYEFIRQRLGEDAARQYLENQANPMIAVDVQQPDGSTVRQFIRPPAGAQQPPLNAPAPGTIEDGYRFRGGDPADPQNWEPVQGGAASGGQRPFADPTAFRGGRMTSGRRTAEGNRLVGGDPNSLHLTGDAADYVPLPGETLQQLLARAREYFPAGNASIHNGNHVHVSQRGYGRTPYYGRRGTTGR